MRALHHADLVLRCAVHYSDTLYSAQIPKIIDATRVWVERERGSSTAVALELFRCFEQFHGIAQQVKRNSENQLPNLSDDDHPAEMFKEILERVVEEKHTTLESWAVRAAKSDEARPRGETSGDDSCQHSDSLDDLLIFCTQGVQNMLETSGRHDLVVRSFCDVVYTYSKETAKKLRRELKRTLDEASASNAGQALDAEQFLKSGLKRLRLSGVVVARSQESLCVIGVDDIPRSVWVRLTNIWSASEDHMRNLAIDPSPIFHDMDDGDLEEIIDDVGDIFLSYNIKIRRLATRLVDVVIDALVPTFESALVKGLQGCEDVGEWTTSVVDLLDRSLAGPAEYVPEQLYQRWLRNLSRMVFGVLEMVLCEGVGKDGFPPPSEQAGPPTAQDHPMPTTAQDQPWQLFFSLINKIKKLLFFDGQGLDESFIARLAETCVFLVGLHSRGTKDLIAQYKANEAEVRQMQEAEGGEQDLSKEEADAVRQNNHIFRVFCARKTERAAEKYIEERGITTIGRLPERSVKTVGRMDPLKGQTHCVCEIFQGSRLIQQAVSGTVYLTKTHLCFEENVQEVDEMDTADDAIDMDPFTHVVELQQIDYLEKKKDGEMEMGINPLEDPDEAGAEPEPEPEPETEPEPASAKTLAPKIHLSQFHVTGSGFSLRNDLYSRICERRPDLENVSGSEWEGVRKLLGLPPSEVMLGKYECRVDLPGKPKWGRLYVSAEHACYNCEDADPPLRLKLPLTAVATCRTVAQENRGGLTAILSGESAVDNLELVMSDQRVVLFIFSATSKQRHGIKDAYSKIVECKSKLNSGPAAEGTARPASPTAGHTVTRETYELKFMTQDTGSVSASTDVTVEILGELDHHTVKFTPSGQEVIRNDVEGRYRFVAPQLGNLQRIVVRQDPRVLAAQASRLQGMMDAAMGEAGDVEHPWALVSLSLMEESTTRMFSFVPGADQPLLPGRAQEIGPPAEGPAGRLVGFVIEECYENETLNWTASKLLAREPWSDARGRGRLKDSFELPNKSWSWDGDWTPDNGADTDAEGWAYSIKWDGAEWTKQKVRLQSQVRRRKWIRVRRLAEVPQ